MKLKKKEDKNVDALIFLRREKKTGEEIKGQTKEQGLKKRSTEATSPGESPHMQPANPNTIADAKKCLLAGTRYGMSPQRLSQSHTDTDVNEDACN